ncbi:Cytospin-B [Tupaia chinensis]|uniref:Cytospin-B n=1 Tax=Tupaia chinensis TaxID=246437 RepID=L9KIQ6_TUPCH|nr:Cytospin-B [Tupaia chinensis]
MRSAAKPWSPAGKAGSHGPDRARPLPTAASGMRSSKSSTSLAFESRLSKLKRASSEDMLNKPGCTATAGVVRMKKTATAGAISELAESRLRSNTGAVPATKRTGIPAPRELPVTVSRERSVPRGPCNPRKSVSSPTSSSTPTPTKHLRAVSTKPRQESEGGEKAVLESQVRELLAEAKAKDSEINRLRSELKKCKEKRALSSEGADASDPNGDAAVSPGDPEPLIRALEEKNRNFQKELADLEEENRVLREKLTYLEQSPNSEGAASPPGDSSCPTSITQESSFESPTGNPLSSEIDEYQKHMQENALRTSGSSSSDVTKASLSPDASDFEHITADTPSRPLSSTSNPFKSSKCSTSGSSPNNVSELSLASLTEKIQKMEENQHSTAEELQATLQELSDQQQMVQELTAENEKLVDEKTLLETSFQQHRERAEQLSQENEKLLTLLQERVQSEEPSTQGGKVLELEHKCTEILEQGRFEREKLLNIQQQLTCRLRKVEEENQGAAEVIGRLREENEKLSGFLELERHSKGVMAQTLEECRVTLEGLKMENGSLKAHLEGEKQKAVETGTLGQMAESCDVEMLKAARAEKDQLELSCTELRQELLKANGEIQRMSSLLAKIRIYVAKATTPCFPKGLENIYQVPLLFPFVFVILVNYWKMAVPAKRKLDWHFIINIITPCLLSPLEVVPGADFGQAPSLRSVSDKQGWVLKPCPVVASAAICLWPRQSRDPVTFSLGGLYSQASGALLVAHQQRAPLPSSCEVEKDYAYLKEISDHQAEQLSRTSLKLQEKASESDAEIKDMKETIFELEDQVEQHRAVKLHNNQLISELESKDPVTFSLGGLYSQASGALLVAHQQRAPLPSSCEVEKDYAYLKEISDHQAEQLSRTSLKLQEKASESDAEIKDMKETIFELEDQVEQHRAVKLHNNQLISELESNVIKLQEQKSDLERQLKTLTKQIKEETEEWRRFQADLQTAVVVANDIKCEAQQELRTVMRRLLEEEEKNARLQKELGDMQGHGRPVSDNAEPSEVDAPGRWHGVYVSRASPTPSESATTVKSLIKSFDLGRPGGAGQNMSVHKTPRSPLSGIPVRTAPAAAVSPMQRHSTYSSARPAGKAVPPRMDLPDLPLSDLLKGRAEDLKPDPYLRKSPSLESLSRPPSLGFGNTRILSASTGGLKPQSKLSVERRDPLAALAREYGGSKRNALLKWCQKKTEGYAVHVVGCSGDPDVQAALETSGLTLQLGRRELAFSSSASQPLSLCNC